VISVSDHYWLHAFALSSKSGWCAVHIAAGNHQNTIAAQPVIARKNIGWEEGACDVAEVRFAIGVWPRDSDKNLF